MCVFVACHDGHTRIADAIIAATFLFFAEQHPPSIAVIIWIVTHYAAILVFVTVMCFLYFIKMSTVTRQLIGRRLQTPLMLH